MTYQRPRPRTKYSGVYAIRHKKSGRAYVGASNDMTNRWGHHRFCLRRGVHKSRKLQDLWSKKGETAFEFVILERCNVDRLDKCEMKWIRKMRLLLLNSFLIPSGRVGCRYKTGPRGPSPAGSAAARRRWQRPDYRKKQMKARKRRYG